MTELVIIGVCVWMAIGIVVFTALSEQDPTPDYIALFEAEDAFIWPWALWRYYKFRKKHKDDLREAGE